MKRAVVEAPANIALVKYWGKRNEELNLPLNDSLSMTLDLTVKTEVTLSREFDRDEVYVNQRRLSDEEVKEYAGRVMRSIRKVAGDQGLRAVVRSVSTFPESAGLASSAAGMAALVWACNEALGLGLDRKEISKLAREGSGSACRSIFGGFVLWKKGTRNDGSDSYCEELFPPSHWDLVDVIGLVSDSKKKISSREGMKRVRTAPTLDSRLEFVNRTLPKMIESIANRDESSFYELVMRHSNSMHSVIMDSWPPTWYLNDISIKVMEIIYAYGKAAYTFDAGPNPHVITSSSRADEIENLLRDAGARRVIVSKISQGPRTLEVG
ncbi:diphosphomevalonate decarboxylase [Sulfodiicoccus acidiphilus]|uniref:Diphosphomevalonate decarboxylase n=1 Tax=Sulfodiicoccus acidiphilus TaxID=1670455 RepID=A0A348B0H1_9CREN|nr:diphosphomevalonate decarboxylase [Sulfodiicoccus acidiphilus]BBD71673.1 diphosphomevalonate decarboxylase [Sulfodiicoccus acidiphilus]GGT86698.1 diphosphomevalonate decarboxylase [Sulfodiicoccus acidiphilus]